MPKKFKKDSNLRSEIRINKFLADAGVCSRRKADDLIESGVVKVNRKPAEPGMKVRRTDKITVKGDPVGNPETLKYFLLNKPKDYISTADDEKDRKKVLDLIKSKERIYPVGRLDRNTTGALLLTNDGELAHRLTHPSFQVERTYVVGLDKPLAPELLPKIAGGVRLAEYDTSPCDIFIMPDDPKTVMITLREGKNREIRNLFEHFGYDVKKLDRKAYANLTSRGLKRGEYRRLERKELLALKKIVGMT